ncbi:unnamed protein product [Colias eurytheme]|nr:unnamed protein product [Colias eurytheme]
MLPGARAGCGGAGAAAAPRRAAPPLAGPRALRRLGTAHVRSLPAATWSSLTGSAYKRRSFPHRITSCSTLNSACTSLAFRTRNRSRLPRNIVMIGLFMNYCELVI